MGMTFKVSRPGLLPIGLVTASVCTVLRFFYYGFMLKKSPYRFRRDAIDGSATLCPGSPVRKEKRYLFTSDQ